MTGLYRKYHITKTDGSPVDPTADYFVLRLDSGEYVDACRAAMRTFRERVEIANAVLASDIESRLLYHDPGRCPRCNGPTKQGDGELEPQLYCDECGVGWDYPSIVPWTDPKRER